MGGPRHNQAGRATEPAAISRRASRYIPACNLGRIGRHSGNAGFWRVAARVRAGYTELRRRIKDIRDDFHRIVYAASHDAARAAYVTFERIRGKRCSGVVASLREGGDELLTSWPSRRLSGKHCVART
jgi:hypothetical protein